MVAKFGGMKVESEVKRMMVVRGSEYESLRENLFENEDLTNTCVRLTPEDLSVGIWSEDGMIFVDDVYNGVGYLIPAPNWLGWKSK